MDILLGNNLLQVVSLLSRILVLQLYNKVFQLFNSLNELLGVIDCSLLRLFIAYLFAERGLANIQKDLTFAHDLLIFSLSFLALMS